MRTKTVSPFLAASALAVLALSACAPPLATAPRDRPPPSAAASQQRSAVDATTLSHKLLFGYQGWFGCPDDGSPLARWQHWFRSGQTAGAATLRVDMWPDLSELPVGEQCRTPLTLPDGRPAVLYSAYRPAAVDMHFRWLEEYELPGVFLQRFTPGLDRDATRDFRDTVARNVRAAAEAHGRVFALMYDISGHRPQTLVEDVKRDWAYMVDTLRITESPRYLHHNGRPLLAIWGFGFVDRPATPTEASELIAFFRNHFDPRYRVTLLGGVPARWRTLTNDSKAEPEWAHVYRSFDVISPWTVGRFRDDDGVERFYREHVATDLIETRRAGLEYMPVTFPGFSWRNMNPDAGFNQIPRRGGRFFWRQVEQALASGATMLFSAMFDEVDEGTAMFKIASTARDAPAGVTTVTLDADGEPLPSDWYLQLAREAQKRLSIARSAAGAEPRSHVATGSRVECPPAVLAYPRCRVERGTSIEQAEGR
jgi:hypothetical protein